MTLANYSPDQLDALTLRLLDIAAIFREMSLQARQQGLEAIPLHDRKAQEWCDRLEHWARRAQVELDLKVRMDRAARRAQASD